MRNGMIAEPFPLGPMEPQIYQIPPPELVEQWMAEIWHEGTPVRVSASDLYIATQAAQWGADQELEACVKWLDEGLMTPYVAIRLSSDRRPKPPSLKEQAIKDLDDLEINLKDFGMGFVPIANLRKALEALPND